MRKYVLIFLVVVLVGCDRKADRYNEIPRFNRDCFKEKVKLENEKINYGPIHNPSLIKVIDTVVFLGNKKTEYFVDMYNLNTGELLEQFISKGKGPKEMIYLKWIQKISKSKSLVAQCSQTKKIIRFNFKNSKVELTENAINNKGAINTQLIGGKFVGFSYNFENINRLYYYNEHGDLIDQKGRYPTFFSKVENGLDAHIGEAAFSIKPDNSKIAIAYTNSDLIEIYSVNGEVLKQIVGPDLFKPMFEVVNNKGYTSIVWDKKQRTAYMQIVSDNEYIYALYSGKLNLNEEYMNNTEIFKFDWEGNPQTIYILDKSIFTFDVNFEDGALYGLSFVDKNIYKYKI